MNQQKKAALNDASAKKLEEFKTNFKKFGVKMSYTKIIEMALDTLDRAINNSMNNESDKEEFDRMSGSINNSLKVCTYRQIHENPKSNLEATKTDIYAKNKITAVSKFEDYEAVKINYTSCPCAEIVVASNGGKDGDWGHGGRTYFSFNNLSCFETKLKIENAFNKTMYLGLDDLKKMEIIIGGECETHILRDIFKECYETLDKAIKENKNAE